MTSARLFAVTTLAAAVATCPYGSIALARPDTWTLKRSEDPISDQKTAIVAVDGDDISVGFKCWGGDPNATAFTVILPGRYDDAADYKDAIEVIVRIDKGDPILLSLRPIKLGRSLALSAPRAIEPKVTSVMQAISSAKTRVAVAFGDSVFTVSARGAPKAIGSFIESCSSSG